MCATDRREVARVREADLERELFTVGERLFNAWGSTVARLGVVVR